MNCESFDARLDALLDGRCTPGEWAEAEAHLAACARCRGLFEAISGRADDLDADGHEELAAAVVAKTSGSGRACASARERLCAFVDGELEPFDRELVEGHLEHCGGCAALAAAVAEQSRVLSTFAGLAPRHGFVGEVLAATSRRRRSPSAAEKVAAWLSRAAERPRFSLEVAYVMTVLLLVVLGNPVDAFREASVRVQPRVSAVASAVSGPLHDMRAAGAEKIARVEHALTPTRPRPAASSASPDGILDSGIRWVQVRVLAPLQSLVEQVGSWAWRVVDSVRRAFAPTPTEPAQPGVR